MELPSNQLAENKLLACIIADNDLIYDCDISSEYFSNPYYGEVFNKIKQLHDDKKTIDEVTISDGLIEIGDVLDIILSHIGTSGFQDYLQTIKDNYHYRKIILASREITAMCYDQKPLDIIHSLINKQIDICADTDMPLEFMMAVVNALNNLGKETSLICKTGYPSLDTLVGGLSRGQLVIVGARPKVGKTSLMLGLAFNTIVQSKKATCYSLEMKIEEMAKRYISRVSGATVKQIELVKDEGFHKKIIERVQSVQADIGLLVVHDNIYTPEGLIRSIKKENKKNGCEVFLIDYLGLIKAFAGDKQLKTYQIQEITTSLKRLANELGVAICLFCQINRSADKEDREPKPSDLKDSGSIEQDADLVILMHRELGYNPDERDQEMELIVALQRKGPMGRCKLRYNKPTMTLYDDLDKINK